MTALKWSFFGCCVVLGCLLGIQGGLAPERLRYEPAIVQLSGKVIVQDHYGPPNFGETPQTREKVPILELNRSIATEADEKGSINRDAFSNVSRVQLIGLRTLSAVAPAGRHVRLQGTLFEKHTGHHYTDVLMNVQQVSLVDRIPSN